MRPKPWVRTDLVELESGPLGLTCMVVTFNEEEKQVSPGPLNPEVMREPHVLLTLPL